MDTAVIITLISTLLLSIIGNIAAWWQIANQAKKDKAQTELDKARLGIEENKANIEKDNITQTAALTMIESQRIEIERLHKRGLELEDKLVSKTTENGDLKLAAIDKEAELRTLRYQMKLMNIVPKEQPLETDVLPMDIKKMNATLFPLPLNMELEVKEDQKKKLMISKNMNMEIRELRNNSINKEIKE